MTKKPTSPATNISARSSANPSFDKLAIYERAAREQAEHAMIEVGWQADRKPQLKLTELLEPGDEKGELWPRVLPPQKGLLPRAGHSVPGLKAASTPVAIVAVFGLSEERIALAVRKIEARQQRDANFIPLFLTDHANQTAIRHAGYNLEYFPSILYEDPGRASLFRDKFLTIWKKWNAGFLLDLSNPGFLRSRIADIENFISPEISAVRQYNPRRPVPAQQPPAAIDLVALKAEYASKELDGIPDTFALYRVIGNDLPPRHEEGQTLNNLKFILENEPPLKDCDKRWIVNRIVDEKYEAEIISLLEAHGQHYIRLEFDLEEYRKIDWDFEPFEKMGFFYREEYEGMSDYDRSRADVSLRRLKNNYVMNNNGARNVALRDGRDRAKWVLPWDGNCFLTQKSWAALTAEVRQRQYMKYFTVPLWRAGKNEELLEEDLEPTEFSEPQILFRCDTCEEFDERFPYGRRPKIELFWRLGIRGYWDEWPDDVWDLPRPQRSADAGSVGQAGWVSRLSSGQADLEGNEESGLVVRGMARNVAIISLIDRLDQKALEKDFDATKLTAYHEATILSLPDAPPDTGKARIFQRLLQEAELALQRGPYSVTDKSFVPPSGDKQDYYHPAPYWWPNPHTPSGLPGSYRDGERAPGTRLYEPESDRYDRTRLQLMFDDTAILALAGASSGEAKYLTHAALLVRHWFLGDATRMNPDLRYAQVRPGSEEQEGRGRGIIEMKDLYFFLDAIRLLERKKALTKQEQKALRGWLQEYLEWLLTSEQGLFECRASNNHGTYYDLQVGSIAAFLGDTALLLTVLRRSRERIPEQFEKSGRQKHELKRTQTAHYCCFNLQAWAHLANLAEACGGRLWDYETADGRSLTRAFEWLLPKSAEGKWPYQQIELFDRDRFLPLVLSALAHCGKPGAVRQAFQFVRKPIFHPHDGIAPFWMLSGCFHASGGKNTAQLTKIVDSLVGRTRTQSYNSPEVKSAEFADRRMWGGYSGKGKEDLEAIRTSTAASARDRDLAASALARWHRFNEDHRSALDCLRSIASPNHRASMASVLLESECLVHLGQRDEARILVSDALRRMPEDPNLCLAMANTYAGSGSRSDPAGDEDRLNWINRIFLVNGLATVAKKNPHDPLGFFNVTGTPVEKLSDYGQSESPKVSVLMPVFNASETIHIALSGLMGQSWRNIEVIVVDDMSTDQTPDIVEEFTKLDNRIALVRRSKNGGAYPARNLALEHAVGDFVMVHDSDDWSHPQKIEMQVGELLKPNAPTGVFSDWARVNADLFALGYWRPISRLSGQNQSSLLLPRELLTSLGAWDNVRVGADNELIWRIKGRYGNDALTTVYPDVPLSFSLVRDESLTRQRQTHVSTFFYGLRRDYHRSYRRWHAKLLPEELSLLANSDRRPFPAPRVMLPDVQEPAVYQRVYISDFANSAPLIEEIADAIEADLQENVSIGIFHWPDYSRDADLILDERISEMLDLGRIEQVSAYQDARAETLVLCDPFLARFRIDGLPDFGCDRAEVLCRYSGSHEVVFDPRQPTMPSRADLEELFGATVYWVPFQSFSSS